MGTFTIPVECTKIAPCGKSVTAQTICKYSIKLLVNMLRYDDDFTGEMTMNLKKTLVLASTVFAALAFSQSAVAGCFTVYNAKGQLVKRSASSPVDMQYHLHQTVPSRYGKNASMVFASTGESCSDYTRETAQGKSRKGKKASKNAEATFTNPDDVLENLAASYRRDIPGFGSVIK